MVVVVVAAAAAAVVGVPGGDGLAPPPEAGVRERGRGAARGDDPTKFLGQISFVRSSKNILPACPSVYTKVSLTRHASTSARLGLNGTVATCPRGEVGWRRFLRSACCCGRR